MTDLPNPKATRLQNLVWTMRSHGNELDNLNIECLASFNKWTTAEAIVAEFRLQQNGSRKLPEEIAAGCPITSEEEE